MENVQSFDGKQVENSTYNRVFRPRVIQDYDLKESDVPAFFFVASSSRVTIPHLLFRVDTPSWPVIKELRNHSHFKTNQTMTIVLSSQQLFN
jgi:hypothetical protein